ncbi:MAG: hypothetical protein JWN86_946 [Planctomycetota bacterium]|nr:hypothetical protein [Planctomycetota bacterium]
MFYWIYDLSNWSLALLCTVVFVGFTWTGLLATRSTVRKWMRPQPETNDLVSYFMSAYGVFYGLTLGLIAVGTYQNYTDVDSTINKEAAALGVLYRDVSFLPQGTREELQDILRDYCRHVIDKSWPVQREGKLDPGEITWLNAFQKKLGDFEPKTRGQEALLADTFRQFDDYDDIRQIRLSDVTTGLPAPLWWVVIVGALVNIVLTWLFSVDQLRVHLLLTGLLSLLVALLIFLIAAMDNPFRGQFSVSPDAFVIIRDTLMILTTRS